MTGGYGPRGQRKKSYIATCSEWQKDAATKGYQWRQICGINGHETIISIDETGSITGIKQAFGGDLGTLTLICEAKQKRKVVARTQIKAVLCLLAFVLSTAHISASMAQSLPAGVTPQMAQQFQSMSPAQQQALAQQYGVTLPGSAPQQAGRYRD